MRKSSTGIVQISCIFLYLVVRCVDGINYQGVAATYEKYGGLVATRSIALFVLGLVLATVSCIGLINLQTTNDVLNIWM